VIKYETVISKFIIIISDTKDTVQFFFSSQIIGIGHLLGIDSLLGIDHFSQEETI